MSDTHAHNTHTQFGTGLRMVRHGSVARAIRLGLRQLEENAFLWHDADFMSELGACFVQTRENIKARPYFEAALEANPHHIPALRAMSRLAEHAHQLPLAAEYYERLIALAPDAELDSIKRQGMSVAGKCQRFNQHEAADRFYAAILARDPNDIPALSARAHAAIAAKNLDAAETQYAEAVARFPNDPILACGYAHLATLQGQLLLAEQRYRAVMAHAPQDKVAHCGLAMTEILQQRWRDAEATLRHAAEILPAEPAVYGHMYALAYRQPNSETRLHLTSVALEGLTNQCPHDLRTLHLMHDMIEQLDHNDGIYRRERDRFGQTVVAAIASGQVSARDVQAFDEPVEPMSRPTFVEKLLGFAGNNFYGRVELTPSSRVEARVTGGGDSIITSHNRGARIA